MNLALEKLINQIIDVTFYFDINHSSKNINIFAEILDTVELSKVKRLPKQSEPNRTELKTSLSRRFVFFCIKFGSIVSNLTEFQNELNMMHSKQIEFGSKYNLVYRKNFRSGRAKSDQTDLRKLVLQFYQYIWFFSLY